MGDPTGAASRAHETLATQRTWMIVEPFAKDRIADALGVVGQPYYAFSTMICTPASRSQEVGVCLGTQAGERRSCAVIEAMGFGSLCRAAETPFNMVLEARA